MRPRRMHGCLSADQNHVVCIHSHNTGGLSSHPGATLCPEMVTRKQGSTVAPPSPGFPLLSVGDAFRVAILQQKAGVDKSSKGPATSTASSGHEDLPIRTINPTVLQMHIINALDHSRPPFHAHPIFPFTNLIRCTANDGKRPRLRPPPTRRLAHNQPVFGADWRRVLCSGACWERRQPVRAVRRRNLFVDDREHHFGRVSCEYVCMFRP